MTTCREEENFRPSMVRYSLETTSDGRFSENFSTFGRHCPDLDCSHEPSASVNAGKSRK